MPANLIVALVLLATEWLRYHRTKDEQRGRDDEQPSASHEQERGGHVSHRPIVPFCADSRPVRKRNDVHDS